MQALDLSSLLWEKAATIHKARSTKDVLSNPCPHFLNFLLFPSLVTLVPPSQIMSTPFYAIHPFFSTTTISIIIITEDVNLGVLHHI